MTKEPAEGVQFPPPLTSHASYSPRKIKLINRIIRGCDMVYTGFKIDGEPSPCWEWLGANSGNGNGAGRGYGRIKVDSHISAVHRVMFVCFHGYLPPKRDVDHLCRNRICCNPDHLKSVTRLQNMRNLRR